MGRKLSSTLLRLEFHDLILLSIQPLGHAPFSKLNGRHPPLGLLSLNSPPANSSPKGTCSHLGRVLGSRRKMS
jgi:hypothetical protein